MCTANIAMEKTVEEYLSLKIMMDEIQANMDELKAQIVCYMGNAETMVSGAHIVRHTLVTSSRTDTKALRELLGDALDPYIKHIDSRRFSIK